VPAAAERIKEMDRERALLQERWEKATEASRSYHDAKHQPKEYKVQDLVLLNVKNLKLRQPCKKLTAKFSGPYRITEAIGKQAY